MHVCTALHSKTLPIGSAALGTVRPPHPNPAPTAPSRRGAVSAAVTTLDRGAVPHDHVRTDLVQAALAMRGELADEVIMHADRGSPVHLGPAHGSPASTTWSAQSATRRIILGQRASRIILDHNESRVLRSIPWPTKAAAKLAVGDWIERVYNRRRRHSALGMISRVDFDDRLTQTAQAA